jgi:hypothetical protein
MRAGRRLLPLVVLLVVLAATAAVALAGTVSWGSAIEVPGIAALGDSAGVSSVSCVGAGDCTAAGNYANGSGVHPFVVPEQSGVWGSAIEIPGTAALSAGYAAVASVSCARAGDCSAGGSYEDSSGQYEPYVVDETNGSWGTAIEVPGVGDLNIGGDAAVFSVSCGSPGNCAAFGDYADDVDRYGFPDHYETFVITEKNGKWGASYLTEDYLDSVSCSGAGDCLVGGSVDGKAFLVAERNGNWGGGRKVLGMAALSAGGGSSVDSVSCASPGNCAAGGWYHYGAGGQREYAFVVAEKNGKWGTAIKVTGVTALKAGGDARVDSVSCAGVGNCAAAGQYTDRAHKTQAFVVAERNGTWGNGIEVPGTAALNVGGSAGAGAVSCASAGDCAVTGFYTDGSQRNQAFVVAETNGKWGTAVEVPGTAALGGGAYASSVSCASAGSCALGGGSYGNGSGDGQAFVTAP